MGGWFVFRKYNVSIVVQLLSWVRLFAPPWTSACHVGTCLIQMYQCEFITICKCSMLMNQVNMEILCAGVYGTLCYKFFFKSNSLCSWGSHSMKSHKDKIGRIKFPGRQVPNMLLEISGEITPERMKRWSQSKNNTQLWM